MSGVTIRCPAEPVESSDLIRSGCGLIAPMRWSILQLRHRPEGQRLGLFEIAVHARIEKVV